ncbi:hypothetical protein AKJ62_03720 [candidate division MSBL1 archaeon SCGC-AAA259D14]|uniref:Uncharacterized protein n=1 Tax=candidate division MSBL1 archaeon SCGC-AAA259D14 TaxID=1698261 RepID=A0A133U4L3_9EURY|nr:hypothetical protein AKJ62_03720 [candidate division MSBL1 archaeon SCGC-AAA259D14]
MSEDNKKELPDGTPLQKMDEYEGISIPRGINVYTVKDEESVHYNQIFRFDEENNLELIDPNDLLEKIRKTNEEKQKIESVNLERKKKETEVKFDRFLEEELGMSRSEYLKESKGSQKLIDDAFRTWLSEKTAEK